VPRVFAVVQSALTIDNTVNEVCVNLATLLRSMSDALSLMSNGTTHFNTNVTSLDGQTCVDNICPQCGNFSLLNATFIETSAPFQEDNLTTFVETTAAFDGELMDAMFFAADTDAGDDDLFNISSGRRRLLSSSVVIVIVSQSNTSVPATSPPLVISPTLLLAVLSTPGLTVGSIVASVTTMDDGSVVIVVVEPTEDDSAFLRLVAIVIGILVAVVLLFVSVAVCRWMWCKSVFFVLRPTKMHARMYNHSDPVVRLLAGKLVLPKKCI